MADVFISYSKSHLKLTRNLAEELEAKGLTVWWDTDLIAGESFRDRIVQEIKTCRAAIVIWTRDSVQSDYVVSEAERARVAGKLIQLRTADVEPTDLPPPFDTSHISLVEDRKAIYGALGKLGLLRDEATVVSGPLPPFRRDKSFTLERASQRRLVTLALATVIALGVLAIVISFRSEIVPIFRTTSAGLEERATKVITQFFEELNAGLGDSSQFAADVRLGGRGLMSKIEAVTELRKLPSLHRKIYCRMSDGSLTLRTPEFAQDGFRAKIYCECDLTDNSGTTTTRRFPLEIEAGPDPHNKLLITGLWHPEEMVLWQRRPRD
jgi:hypothetical protein